jgi:hypothetical protein
LSNTAVGYECSYVETQFQIIQLLVIKLYVANTTGCQNTAVGASTLDANTTAINNTAVGYVSLGC